jgi:hypothetical protein
MRGAITLAAVFAAAALAVAAPPEVPKALTTKPGKMVRIVVKTDAEIGIARTFGDGENDPFFGELIAPKGERHFVFQAPEDLKEPAQYTIAWWTASEKTGATTIITVGKPTAPIGDPAKPPVTTDVFYFAVVGPNQATQEIANAMSLSAWDEVRAKGHTVNYIPVSELNPAMPKATSLPYMVILKKTTDNKWTTTPYGVLGMPTNNDAIRSFIK